MCTKTRLALAGLSVVAAVTAATPALASDGAAAPTGRGCAEKFDEAQREDMESFRDYDLGTWTAGHDDDAITVLAAGVWFQGRDRIAQVLRRHFTDREATWTWTEVTRAVDGCKTATILYDATYTIPSIGYSHRAYVSVIYTYKHGRWLTVLDQSTPIPAG